MKRIILLALIVSVALAMCKKDDSNDPDPLPTETVLNYFPLNIGNYWVYERSACDSSWTDCTLQSTDTSFITKDTIINGFNYFKLVGINLVGYQNTTFLRDSLNYIIDHVGNIFVSDTDFESIINEEYVINNNDTLFHWYSRMQEELYSVVVPAGNYDCLDRKMSFFRKQENFEKEFNTHCLYAKNVGPVYQNNMYASSGSGFKQELIDFKIVTKSTRYLP